MDFVQSMHDKELLQESYQIDHVGVLGFPLCEGGLGLHSAQVLKGNVDLEFGHLVLELDDRNLCRDDLGVALGNVCVFQPPSRLVEYTFARSPVRQVDDRSAALVVPIGDIYKIHVSGGQVESCGEGAKAKDTAVFLRKPALTQCNVDAIDEPVALVVLVRLGCNEVIEVEDFVVKPGGILAKAF